MSNLLTRILVAIVGIPLMIWIILSGSWAFALLVAVLSTLGTREFYLLSEKKAVHPNILIGTLAAFVLPMMIHYDFITQQKFTLIIALITILTILTIELWRQQPHPLMNVASTLGGLFYVSGTLCTLLLLRDLNLMHSASPLTLVALREGWQGLLILCMFVTVWTGDSAAYFVGVAMGKHKIFPRVSPKKSWEGTIAGFLFSPLAFCVSMHYLLPDFPLSHALTMGVIIGIVGPIGDFAESLLKRDASIKDSSGLIPGHGGVLDRFDSIMFVAPTVYVYLSLIV